MFKGLLDKIKVLFCKWSKACSVDYVCELDSHNCHNCFLPGCRHIHSYCHNHFSWYRRWHHHPLSTPVHWGIFIVFLISATTLLYSKLARNVDKVEADSFTIAASSTNLVVLDVTIPDAWDNGSFTADIIQKAGTNIFWQGDILNNITSLGSITGVGYKEDGTAGFQGTEAVIRDLDSDSVYTNAADVAADCDGEATTGVGTCAAISAGATLVSMGSDKLDFDNNGSADGRPLCADSLTAPTNIAKDNNPTCNNGVGGGGTTIRGSTGSDLTVTVTNNWAFKDGDGDNLLDLGEDLYIQETAGKTTYSSGGDINVYTTAGLSAGDSLTNFASDCDSAGSGTQACKFTGSAPIDSGESILIDEGPNNGALDKQADQLTGLGIQNIGTAEDSTDISAVKIWAEDGTTAGFQSGQDVFLGTMSIAGNTKEWRLSGLTQAIAAGGQRIYVTADISATPTNATTLNFLVPTYNDIGSDRVATSNGDIGYFVSSNNQEPAADVTSSDTFTIDTEAPTLSEATPIGTTTDTTPDYVFSSNEAGSINYAGDCSSVTTNAVVGDNAISFNELGVGVHNNCTITVTDAVGNTSDLLSISSFTIEAPPAPDTTPPALTNFTSTTANGSFGPGSTINITANYNELLSGGSLTVVLDNENQTQVVLNNVSGQTVSGDYIVGGIGSGEDTADLTIGSILSESVSDLNSNPQTASTIPGGGNLGDSSDLLVDVTTPVISEIASMETETTDPTPNYLFIAYESGDINYGGSCALPAPTPSTVTAGTETLVTFGPLADNTYSDCAITVADGAGNASNVLNIISFTIDSTPPTGLANFSADEATLSAQDLSWSSASDVHFDHYEIWYGTIKNDVINRTGTAMEWDDNDDAELADASAISTTITGLNSSTLYYYKIFAFDTFGNGMALISINAATDSPPPSSEGGGSGGSGSGGGGSGGGTSGGGWSWSESEEESEIGSESEIELAPEPEKPLSPSPTPLQDPLIVIDPTFDPVVLAAIKKIPNIKLLTTLNHGLALNYVGEEIKALQKFFNAIGITVAKTGPGSPGKETRKLGFNTREAVRRFQIKYGVVKNPQQIGFGYVGPGTRAKIKEILKRI